MIRTAWRIFKPKHAAAAFTGEGAKRFGGRWNSTGTAMVYCAGSASLAALEMLVHLHAHQVLESYSLCEVRFDDSLVESIDPADLPKNWRSDPAPAELKRIGDEWVRSESSAVLCVPNAILDIESNYLLSPAHPQFSRIDIGPSNPFQFDPRLLK